MNLLVKINLCFVLLLSLNDLNGQTNFRPGYVITNSNDTLRGIIDYGNDVKNAKKCDFKENKDSEVKEFQPFSIKGFRFTDDKYFESKSIKSNGEEIQLFLEVLVHGTANLYYYNDGVNFHYFIEKADGRLYEFTRDQSFAYIDGKVHTYSINMSTGLLRSVFADRPKIFSTIDVTSLDDIGMIKLVKKYNDYEGGEGKSISYKKQLPGVKIKFAPLVSFNASSLKFNNTYSYDIINLSFASTLSRI